MTHIDAADGMHGRIATVLDDGPARKVASFWIDGDGRVVRAPSFLRKAA